jgi:hypothetical protein
MKLSIHWLGRDNATVTFSNDHVTVESSVLNPSERADLANHLREVADDLSPSSEEP